MTSHLQFLVALCGQTENGMKRMSLAADSVDMGHLPGQGPNVAKIVGT